MNATRRGLLGAATLLASPALMRSAWAAPVTWKVHSVWVESRPEAKALKKWADLVNQRAGDRLKLEVFPGGSLGIRDVDMLRILPQGAIQAAGLYPGYLTRDVPEIATLLPPGIFQHPDNLVSALEPLSAIYRGLYEKWRIRLAGLILPPNRDTSIFGKEPIQNLAELRGKKLRVWEKHSVDAFGKLGVPAQIVPQGDMYVALKTGVLDCALYSPAAATTISLQEVTPYYSYIFPYILHPINIVISQRAYDALPSDLKTIVDTAAQEVQADTIKEFLAGDYDKASDKDLAERGAKKLPPFPEADQQAFNKAAIEAWKEESDRIGGAAIKNRETVEKLLKA